MQKMIRLWSHEVMRVFQDRLINEEDRIWFCSLVKDVIGSGFKAKLETVLGAHSKSALPEVLPWRYSHSSQNLKLRLPHLHVFSLGRMIH